MSGLLNKIVGLLPDFVSSFSDVFEWFATPISEMASGSAFGDVALGVFGDLSPLTIMFASGLTFYLIYTLVSWVIDILP
ncbi:MAG: hypothetical protein IJ301_04420 [Clostridia bacterium]|nr:hypothetical protein [Clostridia bacterium]